MDKSKSKDNLRAAGKKRLEEFRQRKQQKGSSTKSVATNLKVLKDEDGYQTERPHDPNSSITQPSDDVLQNMEGHRCGHDSSSLAAVSQLEMDPAEGLQAHDDGSPIPAHKENPIAASSDGQIGKVESSRLTVMQENIFQKETDVTEVQVPKKHLEELAEKKQVCNAVLFDAEEHLGDASNAKSLAPQIGLIQQESNFVQNERGQVAQNFALSNRELCVTNQDLVSELMLSHQQVVEAKHEASLLLAELELAKVAMVETKGKFSSELEKIQQVVIDEQAKRAQSMTNLATSNETLQELQAEKALLVDELERFGHELCSLRDERLRVTSELETSKQCVQRLEEHLEAERMNLQQVEEVVKEKSQLVEESKDAKDKLESFLLAKELEVKTLTERGFRMETESSGLKGEVKELRHFLDHAKLKEEQLCGQQAETQEELRRLGEEKLELVSELTQLKLLTRNVSEEKTILLAKFDLELGLCRENLQKIEEENLKQKSQLQSHSDDHVDIIKKMEFSLDECSKTVDGITQEKLKVVDELNSVKEQLCLLTDEKGQEIASLGQELQECKALLKKKLEENSSLVILLEQSTSELQTNAQRMAELAAELENCKVLCNELVEEKGSSVAELFRIGQELQLMHGFVKEHECEVERLNQYLKEVEGHRTELSMKLIISIDELSRVQSDKGVAELDLVSYREQVTKLEEQNSVLVRLLEDSKNDVRRFREDHSQSTLDLASELEEQRLHSIALLEEKERLASELQQVRERWQHLEQDLDQSRTDHNSELDKHGKWIKELEERCTELSNKSLAFQDELSKLSREKIVVELESASYQERLMKLTDVNKDLERRLEEHSERLHVIIDEKAELLVDHGCQLATFKEQLKGLQETNLMCTAHEGQLLTDLENLKNESIERDLELQNWKEQYWKLETENRSLASNLTNCQKELELTREKKASEASKLVSELEEYMQQVKSLEDNNALLTKEVADLREHLKRVNQQKLTETAQLQQQVNELVQSNERVVSNLVEKCHNIQELELECAQLVSNLECLSEEHKEFSEVKDGLVRDVEHLHHQVKEKGELVAMFEASSNMWQSEKLQLSRDLEDSLKCQETSSQAKEDINIQLAELILKIHEMDVQQVQLSGRVNHLKKLMETKRETALLGTQVETEDLQLQTVQIAERQFGYDVQAEIEKDLGYPAGALRLPEDLGVAKHRIEEMDMKMAQLRVDYEDCQTQLDVVELRLSKVNLVEENILLAGRVEILEGNAVALKTDRDNLINKLVELEETLSARTTQDSDDKMRLQDNLSALEVQLNLQTVELENHKERALQLELNVELFVQKLEDLLIDAFPGGGKLLSSQDWETSADYFYHLANRLRTGIAEVRDQLKIAHVQLSEMPYEASWNLDKLKIVEQERDMILDATENCHLKREQEIKVQEELEACLKKSEEFGISERQDLVIQIKELTQRYVAQLVKVLFDKASLQAEVSSLQAKIAEQEAVMMIEAASFSKLEGDVKAVVAKLLSGALVALEDAGKDAILLDTYVGSQLELIIAALQKEFDDSRVQNEQLKQKIIVLSAESKEALHSHKEESAHLQHMLQSMEETFRFKELEREKEATFVAYQAEKVETMLLQIQRLSEQMEERNAEKESLQLALAQAEQKLSLTREELSLAVSKGKAVIQQRDAWKVSLAEKSKELDVLVVSHEQHLQVRDAALKDAELKMRELVACRENIVKLETQLGCLKNAVTTVENMFQGNDSLVEGFWVLLDSLVMPHDWHSSEFLDKVLWIIDSFTKVVPKLVSMKEEAQTFTNEASLLKSSAEESEATVAVLASELERLHLVISQMAEEKVELSGSIKQLDSDASTHRQEKEDLARRLKDQAAEMTKLETEVASLLNKMTEQEELINSIVAYKSLEEGVCVLVTNLAELFETISQGEFDKFSDQSSLNLCKGITMLLINCYNVAMEKLKETLQQASFLSFPSGMNSLGDHVFWILKDKKSCQHVPSHLVKMIEDGFANLEQQSISSEIFLQQTNGLLDDLASERNEKNRLRLELTQTEQRLTNAIQKLSSAVIKGESLAQQQDALKKVVADKSAKLELLLSAHEKEVTSRQIIVSELNQRLATSLDHMANLNEELVGLKNSVCSSVDPALVDRLCEMDRCHSVAELKADLAESEVESSKKTAGLLSPELELSLTRLEKLTTEIVNLMKDKHDLLQLEALAGLCQADFQVVLAERTELLSKTRNLEDDLAIQANERETTLHKCEDLSHRCNEMKLHAEEALADRVKLQGAINMLELRLGELERCLEIEADARMKLESDIVAVISRPEHRTAEAPLEMLFDTSTSGDSQPRSQLERLVPLLLVKYETALQEIEELSKEKVWLTETQETMVSRAVSEQQILRQLQQTLDSRGLELSEMTKQMEEAASRVKEQEDIAGALLQEAHTLREELEKGKSTNVALNAELIQMEQKLATTREKLSLAVKKGKGLAQQRDFLKQSLAELELLHSNCKKELQDKESFLAMVSNEMVMYKEQACALELKVSFLTSDLEQYFQEKNEFTCKVETMLTRCNFPVEWSSRELAQKLEWLVTSFVNAQERATLAEQDAEKFRIASVELRSELTDNQGKAEMEHESLSSLALKLEEAEGQLQWSLNQNAELKSNLLAVVGANQQVELLSERIVSLEAMLEQKQAELSRAEETVFAWVERSEESEKYIHSRQERISELEGEVQELIGAQQQVKLLNDKVANLEQAVQQKQAAVIAMEASRSKAVNKLTVTVNKFRELCQQSEGLVAELERMHGTLQEKDTEIARLKEEVLEVSKKCQILQGTLESKENLMLELEKQLKVAVLLDTETDSTRLVGETGDTDQLGIQTPDEGNCISYLILLQKRLKDFRAQSQFWQADMERKESQIQGFRKELDEVVAERMHLKTILQEKFELERLKADFVSVRTPVAERGRQIQEIEEVHMGKRLLPSSSPAPHARGVRKPAPLDIAIDVDAETNQLLSEFDEKGHGFKSLASSRFMPQAARSFAQQVDRLCIAGGRVLMRQPCTRLGLTVYWLAIHLWVVFLILTPHT